MKNSNLTKLTQAQANLTAAAKIIREVAGDHSEIATKAALLDIAARIDGALSRVEGDKSTGLIPFLCAARAGGAQ